MRVGLAVLACLPILSISVCRAVEFQAKVDAPSGLNNYLLTYAEQDLALSDPNWKCTASKQKVPGGPGIEMELATVTCKSPTGGVGSAASLGCTNLEQHDKTADLALFDLAAQTKMPEKQTSIILECSPGKPPLPPLRPGEVRSNSMAMPAQKVPDRN